MPKIFKHGGVALGVPDPNDDDRPKPEEKPGTPMQELVKVIKDRLELDGAKDLAAGILGHGVPPGPAQQTKESFDVANMVAGLAKNMMEVQGAALAAAQQAKSEAEKNYFLAMGEMVKMAQERMKGTTVANVPPDPMQSIESMLNITDKLYGKAQEIAKQIVPTASSGESENKIRLTELQNTNAIALKQLEFNHQISLRELDIKMIQFQAELAKWSRQEQGKAQTWQDILQGAMAAIQRGTKEAAISGPPSAQSLGSSPAGLELIQCTGCGNGFGVAPGVPSVTCPYCNSNLSRVSQPSAPPPPASSVEVPPDGTE